MSLCINNEVEIKLNLKNRNWLCTNVKNGGVVIDRTWTVK